MEILFQFQGMNVHQCEGQTGFIHCTIQKKSTLEALKSSEIDYSDRKQDFKLRILLPNLIWSDSIQIFMSND